MFMMLPNYFTLMCMFSICSSGQLLRQNHYNQGQIKVTNFNYKLRYSNTSHSPELDYPPFVSGAKVCCLLVVQSCVKGLMIALCKAVRFLVHQVILYFVPKTRSGFKACQRDTRTSSKHRTTIKSVINPFLSGKQQSYFSRLISRRQ